MRTLIVLIGISLAVSGCQFLGFDSDDTEDHRETWARQHDGSYSYQLNRGCFCYPAGQFRVQVVDYDVVDVEDLLRPEPLDSTLFEYIETIEDVFDLIDRARRDGADELEVEYAPEGYPSLVNVDWYTQAADDEMYIQISEVEVGESNAD